MAELWLQAAQRVRSTYGTSGSGWHLRATHLCQLRHLPYHPHPHSSLPHPSMQAFHLICSIELVCEDSAKTLAALDLRLTGSLRHGWLDPQSQRRQPGRSLAPVVHMCCSDHSARVAQCGFALTAVLLMCIRSWNPHTPGVSFAQWGQPQAVRFSDCGEHFAAVGEGGVVATWRVDAPRYLTTDTGSLGRAEWCHQVAFPNSRLVCCRAGSSSNIAQTCCQALRILCGDPVLLTTLRDLLQTLLQDVPASPSILETGHGACPCWLIILQACSCRLMVSCAPQTRRHARLSGICASRSMQLCWLHLA